MLKKLKALAAVGIMGVLVLAGCGGGGEEQQEENNNAAGEETAETETYKIGVTQIVEHPSLNAATEGFKKALEDAGLNVEYDEQFANGDQSTAASIANNFVGDGVDLIFANSTPSALSALNATNEIPIVFTSVTDAVEAGLVEANDKPGPNITGTLDNHPEAIPNSVKFLAEELEAKKIGTIYNSAEKNSVVQVDKMKEAAEEHGVEVVEKAVATTADVKTAAESLSDVDAIYIITDNTVVSSLETVVNFANDQDIPLFVGELDSVERGGFAAYGFEYYDIGYEAGVMAADILTGEKSPEEIPVQVPQNLKLLINKKAAEEQGIELKDEWNDIAEFLE